MKSFIVCVDEKVKDNLLKSGFELISSVDNGNGKAYSFENKDEFNFSSNLGFSKKDLMFTNKLMFNIT